MTPTIKLLCLIEGNTVNGPAKNLLNFCRLMRSDAFCTNGIPQVHISLVTFHRSPSQPADDEAPNALVATAREMGITTDVINERFRFDPQVLAQLRAIVARRAPHIIQTHMIKSSFLVKFAGLGKDYPWIAFHHGYTTTDVKMRVYNQLNRWSLPSADRVITVCGEFAKQLTRSGVREDRIAVRHNSVVAPRQVTSDERQQLRDRFGIADDERVVLTVGRLSHEKGHRDLLHAAYLLHELDSQLKFKLLIVGEGPELPDLQQAVNQRGLSERVVFAGHVGDVAPYYAIADAMALPSFSEGSPNVLLEAMAAGVPVVSTSVGGVPEIVVSEEHALLVPARNPQLFAGALHRVLVQPKLAQKLNSNAAARAVEFSPEFYARALVRIYQELVSGPRALPREANDSVGNDPVTTAPGSNTVYHQGRYNSQF